MAGIAESAKKHNQTVRIQGPGALFCVSFHDKEIWDMRDAFIDTGDTYLVFRELLLDRGIHIFPTEKGLWYLSSAHTEKDIEDTLKVATFAHHQFTHIEQCFQRVLGGFPDPPAAVKSLRLLEIRRPQRAFCADAIPYVIQNPRIILQDFAAPGIDGFDAHP